MSFAQAMTYGVAEYALIRFDWTADKLFCYLLFMYFTFPHFTFYVAAAFMQFGTSFMTCHWMPKHFMQFAIYLFSYLLMMKCGGDGVIGHVQLL